MVKGAATADGDGDGAKAVARPAAAGFATIIIPAARDGLAPTADGGGAPGGTVELAKEDLPGGPANANAGGAPGGGSDWRPTEAVNGLNACKLRVIAAAMPPSPPELGLPRTSIRSVQICGQSPVSDD